MRIDGKDQQNVALRSTASNERAISTDSPPFALEFSKEQAKPQTQAVLFTGQQWPYPISKAEQPSTSSAIIPSDVLQPSTFVLKPIKQTCTVIPALRNLTSSHMPIYQNRLSACNDSVSQAAPPEQELVTSAAHQIEPRNPASQDLATLLSFLGPSRISDRLFQRAREPLKAWGENGEVTVRTINMIEVIQDQNLCEKAIYDLHQLRAIHIDASTVNRHISVNPQLLSRIAHDKDRMRWMSEAVKVIFYIFPIDRRLEPIYSFSLATSILPLLGHRSDY